MNTRTLSPSPPAERDDPQRLALRKITSVEISSQDPTRPIEAALAAGNDRGPRAAVPEPQTIRLLVAAAVETPA
jgi:hypothetical protein